jgi:hypothetical protein
MTPYPTDSDVTGPAEEALADQLRRIALDADPVPDLVRASARAALSLRSLDAELAEMVHDSELDTLDSVRGPADDAGGGVRLLSFEAPGISISAQITSSPTGRTLLGQVAGAEVIGVAVQTPTAQIPAELSEAGMFRLDRAPGGSLRLVVTTVHGKVVGDWLTA